MDENTHFNVVVNISELVIGIANIARAADSHQHRSLRPSDVAFDTQREQIQRRKQWFRMQT